jgi:hypothetical protein
MIWNIIDSRGNRYRWARVHAIIEATWHDNRVSGADQAPISSAENEVTFDERVDVSVAEAIQWANAQPCPVTLFLRDKEEPKSPADVEIDAAARILDGWGKSRGWWSTSTPAFDDLAQEAKRDFRFIVAGILRAAAMVREKNDL